MTPGLRKFALTSHISFSVGWLGAVAAFLSLAVAGLTSQDMQTVRAAYLAMDLTARFVIVPLALASLLTGIVQSLGTQWGLFRHRWVLAKLLITVLATIVLLVKMALIGSATHLAGAATLASADLRVAGTQLVVHASGGLLVLLVTALLSVYKPWGLTRYGRRKRQERRESAGLINLSPIMTAEHRMAPRTPEDTSMSTPLVHADPAKEQLCRGLPSKLKIFLAVIGVIMLGFVILHLTGHNLHGH